MCSTCDWTKFEEIDDKTIGQDLGYGSLQIQCDKKHESFYFAVKDQPNSRFRTYHCPTCGQKFY